MLGRCDGTATCEKPSINPLEWFCLCDLPPECAVDADCLGREPPVPGCIGTWACVTDVCEFTPDSVCDEPEVPDAGPTDAMPDAGTPIMDASILDAKVEDSGSEIDAGEIADTGAVVDTGPTVEMMEPIPPMDEGCGCAATSNSHADVWGLPLLLLGLCLCLGRRKVT